MSGRVKRIPFVIVQLPHRGWRPEGDAPTSNETIIPILTVISWGPVLTDSLIKVT